MQAENRLVYTDAAGEQHIDFVAARPHILTVALTVLWFAGWLLLLVLTALEYLRFGRSNLLAIVLIVGGPPVGLALLWAALGKRESLVITPHELRILRWVGPFRLVRSISPSTVIELHAATTARGFRSDFMAVRQFYSGGCGALAIETTHRMFSVGHALSAEAASQVIEHIRRFIPQLSTAPAGIFIPRRRALDYVAGLMTLTLIGFAFNLPARLAITDRPICFYDDTVVPRQPIEVSRIRPAGRVHLVPIADFPPDRAAAIAEHFRREFGVAIDVAPVMEWPEGAYVERRRQMIRR